MFQKGPGDGYMAAKQAALLREPTASCRLSYSGGTRHYRIFVGERDIGCAAGSSRDAWNRFLDRLEAKASDTTVYEAENEDPS